MSRSEPIELFDPSRHRTRSFNCGEPDLDRWLRQYAGQAQRRDAARTFVSALPSGEVLGYYSLIAGEVAYDAATEATRRECRDGFRSPCVSWPGWR